MPCSTTPPLSLKNTLLCLGAFLACAAAPALSDPSPRKIAVLETGDVQSPDMTFSRDGRFLVMLSIPGEKGSDCLVFDRRTHQSTRLPGSGRMEPLGFSRDGHRLWVWGLRLNESLPGLTLKPIDRPFIALYDLRSHRYVRALAGVPADLGVPGGDGVLSRDEGTLIYMDMEGVVFRFDTRTGHLLSRRREQDKGGVPVEIGFNDDGSKLLRTWDADDTGASFAEVVATRTGRVLKTLPLPKAKTDVESGAPCEAVFAPRGPQIAVFVPATQQWLFFDERTAQLRWKIGGPSRASEGDLQWQWSPDARFVGVSGPKGFELRDAPSGRVLKVCPALKNAKLTFSPDGSSVYALKENDTGFGSNSALWQWRLFPTPRQRWDDAHFMRTLRQREARFSLSPRHINESLLQAARIGDAARVGLLLSRGAQVETRDRRSDSVLMNAISSFDHRSSPKRVYQTALVLLAHGANVKKQSGDLLAGAAFQNPRLLKLLLARGAHPNDSGAEDGTALHSAVRFEQLESTRILLEHGANPNARDENGDTPLMTFLEYYDPSMTSVKTIAPIVRVLLAHGANLNARNKRRQSALDLAHEPKMKAFLRKVGAK